MASQREGHEAAMYFLDGHVLLCNSAARLNAVQRPMKLALVLPHRDPWTPITSQWESDGEKEVVGKEKVTGYAELVPVIRASYASNVSKVPVSNVGEVESVGRRTIILPAVLAVVTSRRFQQSERQLCSHTMHKH